MAARQPAIVAEINGFIMVITRCVFVAHSLGCEDSRLSSRWQPRLSSLMQRKSTNSISNLFDQLSGEATHR
jgi:hypothetical protein